MKTVAIVFSGINKVEMGHVQIPDPADEDVVIETIFTSISPGTESRLLSARQGGLEQYPFIPGYANVGRVIGRGRLATLPEGTLVFSGGTNRVTGVQRMWGGHIAHAVQPQNRVFPIPPGVDPIAASLTKLSAISLHGARLVPPLPQDRVLIVGLGPIGQLSARHYQLAGADVFAIDLIGWRVELAKKAGIKAIVAGESLSATALKHWPGGADIIVDCTGAPPVIPELMKVAKEIAWDDQPQPPRATAYLLQGSYSADLTIDYWQAFMKEMRFVLPRDQQPEDLRISLERLASGKLKTRDLVSEIRRPLDAARAYADLQDRDKNLMTIVFDWRMQAT